jgi:tagaturonate reductase
LKGNRPATLADVETYLADPAAAIADQCETVDAGHGRIETRRHAVVHHVAWGCFPAELTKLLHARFAAGRPAPTIFPCELVEANGDKLRALALEVADGWALSEDFRRWTAEECLWINSLVDRIVSAPLEPAEAVAEPYALWAVEKRPGLVMPCRHPCVVVTDDLKPYERLKLFILSLGHTYLAEGWAARGGARSETVRALLADAAVLADLNDLYDREVLPVFDAIGMGPEARVY